MKSPRRRTDRGYDIVDGGVFTHELPEPPPHTEESPGSLKPEDVPTFLANLRATYRSTTR